MAEESTSETVFDPMWGEPPSPRLDLRNIALGHKLPTRYYADQPYFAETADGGLLCVVTTGNGREGSRGQHVLSMKSFDCGETWQDVTPVESPGEPESSWGVPITAPGGRVFVFYVFNRDDIRELPADDPPYPGGFANRMDSHGYYVFRWSDDHGKSWSRERGMIPVREYAIDRENPLGGRVRLFWNVGTAFSHEGSLFLPIHKVGGFGEGWFTRSEGGLLKSAALLSAADPLEAAWETLPLGEKGIRSPEGGGTVAEEHSFTTLSDGSFFTVFRTIDGHAACAYSRDQGESWEPSEYMRYANGRLMKHPRAANFVWSLGDGGYLYFFHNHGGRALREREDRRTFGYVGRNPMWFCRGWEINTAGGKRIAWSQPEVGPYDDDPLVRISYPDYIEHRGVHLFSETQKHTARIHRLPPELTDALSADPERRKARLAKLEPLLEWEAEGTAQATVPMPALPPFVMRSQQPPCGGLCMRAGFAVRLGVRFESEEPAMLLQNTAPDGSGLWLEWSRQRLRITLNDGENCVAWESDPILSLPAQHLFTLNVDGASKTLCFFRDGQIDDGGDRRQYGWGRVNPHYRNELRGEWLEINQGGGAALVSLRFDPRPLSSAEIVHLDGTGLPEAGEKLSERQGSLVSGGR